MRRKVVAGNWKMNMNLSGTIELLSAIKNELSKSDSKTEVIVCPPFTSLETAVTVVKGSSIKVGAQNMHYESDGAFTGEISADMLKSVGCEYVILGHSERRTLFGESDEMINKKVKKALSSGLKPIFCVGETLEERESNLTEKVVDNQVKNGLSGISEAELSELIIAYEPVWAIGTGKTASPKQAQEVHKFIRNLISKLYSNNLADNLVIQYGGSVKPDNAEELFSQPDIDGGLIGGASLKADSFISIVNS
ncbi:MAG TPA: triose-phosphate isomerase [Ignavibacteria bacterium]|nr:triose-phosphate isomerase [Ignavibacteria bacterium]